MIETHICGGCGIEWGAPEEWWKARREDGKGFNCPNGCSRAFNKGESKLALAERERDRLKQENARLAMEAQEEVAARQRAEAETARIKSRAGAGVCPCCNRTFAQLARHMKTKHPEIVPIKKAATRKKRASAAA